MNKVPAMSSSGSDRLGKIAKIIAAVAILSAGVMAMAFGVRTMRSEDLGYHLVYGQRFWQTGQIVDHDDSLYTLPSADTPAGERPEPMVGAWYDRQGQLRFPNANWLTQVIFAGVYQVGGFAGLNVLLMMAVWAIFALLFLAMRRFGVGLVGCAGGMLLFGLISHLRFTLRPELLAYIVLAGQMALLAPVCRDIHAHRLGKRALAGLVVLQLLLVNLHSFFIIGLGLSGAVLMAVVCRSLWRRRADVKSTGRQDDALPRNLRRLALLVGLQIVVCFVNPWTWRLAVLPVRSAAYLGRHHITTEPNGDHPWSWLDETQRTFLQRTESDQSAAMLAWRSFVIHGWQGDVPRAMLSVVLAAAAIGAAVAVRRGRLAWAMWIAAGMYLSMSMHRSMAVGTLIMLPAMLSVFRQARPADDVRAGWLRSNWLACVVGVLVVAACVTTASSVYTDRFYRADHQVRFGMGRSRVAFPHGPAEWFNTHKLHGRLWTDFVTSSNLYFLLDDPRPQVPILTNGWAYPPAVMTESLAAFRSMAGVDEAVRKYDISALVVRTDRATDLLAELVAQRDWVLVYLDGVHAIWLRKSGPDGGLARQDQLTASIFDARAFVEQAEREELWPAYAMKASGRFLADMRWNDQAIIVLRAALRATPADDALWFDLGVSLANRGVARQRDGDMTGRAEDGAEAIAAMRRSLELVDSPETREMLRRMIQDFGDPSPAGVRPGP